MILKLQQNIEPNSINYMPPWNVPFSQDTLFTTYIQYTSPVHNVYNNLGRRNADPALHLLHHNHLREGDRLKDPGIDGRIILKCFFKKWDGGAWTGLIWLRIGTGGGLL
jgi:hypothetical protein